MTLFAPEFVTECRHKFYTDFPRNFSNRFSGSSGTFTELSRKVQQPRRNKAAAAIATSTATNSRPCHLGPASRRSLLHNWNVLEGVATRLGSGPVVRFASGPFTTFFWLLRDTRRRRRSWSVPRVLMTMTVGDAHEIGTNDARSSRWWGGLEPANSIWGVVHKVRRFFQFWA